MALRATFESPGRQPVSLAFSEAADGDFAIDSEAGVLGRSRQRLMAGPWTALRQVHGDRVMIVDAPGDHLGAEGDGLVTSVPGVVVAVQSADCVPVLFASVDGAEVVAAAHAGWRGLYEGIIERTVESMRELGAGAIRAWIGPCIPAPHYEFSEADLTTMAFRFGPEVIAATVASRPALDVVAAARVALAGVGVDEISDEFAWCTATSTVNGEPQFASHRSRAEARRQAAAIRLGVPEATPAPGDHDTA